MTELLSYAAGPTDVPLLDQTIGEALAQTASRLPDAEAVVSCHQGVRLTYGELDRQVTALAKALLASGLRPGDRLGLWSPNNVEWVLLQYATARVGIVLVNINPAYRTTELAYALDQSGCRWLVAAPSFKTSDYRAMVDEVRAERADLDTVVFLDSPEWEALWARSGEIDDEMLDRYVAPLKPEDAINIQYTSGTTGFPKGATLTHRNILNNAYFTGARCGYTEVDRVCVPVPFYHCFGMVMGNLACVVHGCCLVIPGAAFDPGSVLDAVEQEHCTSLYGVPTMFIAVLDHPKFEDYDLKSLRTGIMAGSPCPVEVMKQVVERMHAGEVTICYGMTETSPVSTQTEADDALDRRVSTVGRVHPHVEVQIVDPSTGSVVTRGQAGELCTRGYSVMQGYWNDPQRTADAIDNEGWMHTGDLATLDDEGYVNIVGRLKDMVIRGGENVYPREIEEFLYTHPDVSDVQVIGVPDARYGEELMAWIKPRAGATLDAEDIRRYCEGRIAHFKVPRYVKLVDEFPLTVTGKVQKFKMREQAVAELGLDAGGPTA